VDYYISATDLEPPEADAHYTERLVRLSSLPTYYVRPPVPARLADRDRYGLRATEHVYLCQQNLRKIHPDFDAILADILGADPVGCVALIADEQPFVTELLLNRLRTTLTDVFPRVRIMPRMSRAEYLGLVAAADVVLDTPHYGGGANTVYDAVACAMPTVTMPDHFHRGRWAAAVNRRLGVSELNAATQSDYTQTAVQVATDPELRADLSRRLRSSGTLLFEDGNAVEELTFFFLGAVQDQTARA
jgi:predicted O-linked N-acetylglucosamine transferase (SPINDLY family)